MVDTIKINLQFNDYTDEEGEVITYIETTIEINDKIIQHYCDYNAFLCNDRDNRTWYAKEGNDQQVDYSDFQPFTCSCGISGCAGIWDGIRTKHRKHTIEWRVPKDCGYEFLDKTFYSFDRQQYEQQVQGCRDFLMNNKEMVISDFGDQVQISDMMKYYE